MTPHDKQSLFERLRGRTVVASVSGGKDSAAMCLYLTELGIEHQRVFMDTGWENAITYEYLRGPLTDKLGPITEIRGAHDMLALIRKKGMFPSRQRRFCTQELKVKPMQRHIASLQESGAEAINTVGIRRGESQSRSRSLEWEWSDTMDCDTWRPLVSWSEQDVVDIHKRHGLAPNKLYLQGATRVGCWPCIHARKAELTLVANTDPDRIAVIAALEQEVEQLAAERYAAKGETFESLGYSKPRFYQAPNGAGYGWPIEDVVRWARTDRGGRQFKLFDDTQAADDGCMRWGLCETATEPAK